MGFKEDISESLKKALKEHDAVRVSTLRMLLGAIQYKEVEKDAATDRGGVSRSGQDGHQAAL